MTGLTSAIFAVTLSVVAAGPEQPPAKPGTVPAKAAAPGKQADEPAKSPEKREWTVEKHLQVGGQPATAELKKVGDEAYRFIFTDAGLTSSTIVLAYRKGSDYFLKAAEVHLHDYYGSAGKKGVELKERRLTAEEWNGLQARLKKLDFWNFVPPVEPLGLDGTDWTLEGAAGGKQLTTKIWSPDAGPFRAVGLYLWRTSGTFMGNWADKKQ